MALRLNKSKYLFNLLKSSNKNMKLNYSGLSSILICNKNVVSMNYKMSKIQPSLLLNQNRFYASADKEKQAEIEDKVLTIFRNFDRIKESPAKPQVKLFYLENLLFFFFNFINLR